MSEQIKVVLTEDELPKQWYNLAADFANPMPPPVDLDGNPIGPDALAPVFPMNLIEQEVSQDRCNIPICRISKRAIDKVWSS